MQKPFLGFTNGFIYSNTDNYVIVNHNLNVYKIDNKLNFSNSIEPYNLLYYENLY